MIILLGCTKGGPGKTTHAVNAAAHLTIEGRRVCLVDADEQQHANDWATDRLAQGALVPRVDCRVLRGKVREALLQLAKDYDDIVVDAGGYDAQELRSAMRCADVIVMPFEAGQFEMKAVEKMDELLTVAREYNPRLKALAFINKAETNWVRSRRAQEALAFIGGFDSMKRAVTIVHWRPAQFRNASDVGRSVFEIRGKLAAQCADEVASLLREAVQLVKGPHDVQAA